MEHPETISVDQAWMRTSGVAVDAEGLGFRGFRVLGFRVQGLGCAPRASRVGPPRAAPLLALNTDPKTQNPKPKTPNPQTLNLKPYTLNLWASVVQVVHSHLAQETKETQKRIGDLK